MAKIYLIDSENVGDSWIQLLSVVEPEDKMYVFYTNKSPYISYESLLQVIAHSSIPVFVKCYEGRNALDFQLVTELGFMVAKNPEKEFVIVTDDYGFDAVVKYWTDRQYVMHRITKKGCRPQPDTRQSRRSPQNLQENLIQQNRPGMAIEPLRTGEETEKSTPVEEAVKEVVRESIAEQAVKASEESVSKQPEEPETKQAVKANKESVTEQPEELKPEQAVKANEESVTEQREEPEPEQDVKASEESVSKQPEEPKPEQTGKAEEKPTEEPTEKQAEVPEGEHNQQSRAQERKKRPRNRRRRPTVRHDAAVAGQTAVIEAEEVIQGAQTQTKAEKPVPETEQTAEKAVQAIIQTAVQPVKITEASSLEAETDRKEPAKKRRGRPKKKTEDAKKETQEETKE